MGDQQVSARLNFRHFFRRGLALLLPTVLTIWIVVAAYGFIQSRVAGPINGGVRRMAVWVTPYPRVTEAQVEARRRTLVAQGSTNVHPAKIRDDMRLERLEVAWNRYGLVLDLIGLIVAIAGIYLVGAVVGSLLGRRLFHLAERCIHRVPVVRQVYPAVKQVTEFLVGSGSAEQKFRFSRVVAVELSRKGCWVIGFVTGQTFAAVQDRAGRPCLTVFVPTTPTPVTGFIVMAPEEETVDLPLTIDEAFKFIVSAGVIAPPAPPVRAAANEPARGINLAGAAVT